MFLFSKKKNCLDGLPTKKQNVLARRQANYERSLRFNIIGFRLDHKIACLINPGIFMIKTCFK